MAKFVALWSGGKDSCLACWKAMSQGVDVSCLLNFVDRDSARSMSHGLDQKLIALQAQAVALPIVQRGVTWETYEAEFKAILGELKSRGVTGVVSGDLDLQEHKDWLDRVCGEVGVDTVLPLWGMAAGEILGDFIEAGFQAIVVSVKADFFGKEYLRRKVDSKLVEELQQLKERIGIHPCGESGEYHTFVTDGPLFKKAVKIVEATPVLKDNYWFLDIVRYEI